MDEEVKRLLEENKRLIFAHAGMLHAIQDALRAFLMTHPDPDALTAAFRSEHLQALSYLENSQYPDVTIAAYLDYLKGIAPNPTDWLSET